MINILKSQWYSIRKDRVPWWICIGMIGLNLITCISEGMYVDDYTISYYESENTDPSVSVLLLIFMTSYVLMKDFHDKTALYELLNGHTKKDIFTARCLLAGIVGVAIAVITAVLPAVIGSLIFGWGDEISVGAFAIRQALMILPYLRNAALVILICFVLKNPYLSSFVGVVLFAFQMIILEDSASACYWTALGSMAFIEEYQSFSVVDFSSNQVTIYDGSIDVSVIIPIVVASLVATCVYIALAYHFFKEDDVA